MSLAIFFALCSLSEPVYYFLISFAIFFTLCSLSELIQKMTGRMDDLLVAIRTSRHIEVPVSQALPVSPV